MGSHDWKIQKKKLNVLRKVWLVSGQDGEEFRKNDESTQYLGT